MREIFLEAAAGSTSKLLMISRPVHLIEITTTAAITRVKTSSVRFGFIPLLRAIERFMLTMNNLLKSKNQIISTDADTISSISRSAPEMDRMSPMRYEVYLPKPPPLESITMPAATAVEVSAPIVVSVEAWVYLLITITEIENNMEKTSIDHTGSEMPRSTPSAIPVKEEWPSESEKKAILLLTTIVPSRPRSGDIIKTAANAFFMKSYPAHSNGRIASSRPCNSFINPLSRIP